MAAVTGLIGWAFGLDFWFLWAVLTFLANYVTYVGSVVACVPPIAVAFLQFSSPVAATVLAALVVANRLFWIDYVEIMLTGKRLNVSPLLLLFAIVAFGWLWGVVGMVLSVPLVMAVRIVLLSFEQIESLRRADERGLMGAAVGELARVRRCSSGTGCWRRMLVVLGRADRRRRLRRSRLPCLL